MTKGPTNAEIDIVFEKLKQLRQGAWNWFDHDAELMGPLGARATSTAFSEVGKITACSVADTRFDVTYALSADRIVVVATFSLDDEHSATLQVEGFNALEELVGTVVNMGLLAREGGQ